MRKAYIDNIRTGTVWLVLLYHVCYIYNGVGVLGKIPDTESIPALDTAASIVYPWFMVLLFVLAGMSARYSLMKRSPGRFIKERAVKLLVPSTLGLFVIHWITGYLNIKMGGGLEYIPTPLVYPISVLSGIGPLWFIQMLFLFSCVLALMKKLDKNDRLWGLGGKCGLAAVILMVLPIFGAAQILNMPVLTMYRFGIYFASFLIGYYILSHDGVQEKLERAWIPLLLAAIAGAAAYGVRWHGRDYTSTQCLQSPLTNLYLWAAVLAVIGCSKRWLDRETPVTRYLAGSSYGLYILHYPVLILAGYLLCTYCRLPVWCNYLFTLLAEVIITTALYELIRRVPVVRWLVLGIRGPGKKKNSQPNG